MANIVEGILDGVDTFLAWISAGLKQTTEAYCDLETADSATSLVTHDGSLLSLIEIEGATALIGAPEFSMMHEGLANSLSTAMSRPGHAMQVLFHYDREGVAEQIEDIYIPAKGTAERLKLDLEDLFRERVSYLSRYCAKEKVYIVLWTRPTLLSKEQMQRATKDKLKTIKDNKQPPFLRTQNIIAAIPELRDAHDAYVRGTLNDLNALHLASRLLNTHEAVRHIRLIADPNFTDRNWLPALPGDKISIKQLKSSKGDLSDLFWPSLARQVLPRDAMNLDLRTARLGDRIYSCVFIDLFPKEVRQFVSLFNRTLPTYIPWRMSFFIESAGAETLKLKSALSSVLAFSSKQNRLLSDSANLLRYIELNTDDAVVRLRVCACTWAKDGEVGLLRTRTSELAKAIEGWGSCDVSEISGDPFGGLASTMLSMTANSLASPSVAPLSDVLYMLPITRPASTWKSGALLLRSPDGKPWPFQPGSKEQTTWIDIFYARPGSGKSVLSNAVNLALCLSGGIQRLPRIAITDIGPSSSGLISLLKEALPQEQRHLVAYHRLRMDKRYAINPFDTQLGCRFPTALERSFLVNFLTLIATPLGADKPYDAIPDMAGMVVDELYKSLADGAKPHIYTSNIEPIVDGILEEIGFVKDAKTTWWEVTDALFLAGFPHEAMLAQRYAMPLLADAASICRLPAIEDLYGKITAPTGETLVSAFSRMVSSAVREYPILAAVTQFDLGEARIVSLDLDEVAKSGGDAADRQTAVMYMLSRYVLARHYYLTDENLEEMPDQYREHHHKRIVEIKEDPKRIVYDEFHRTSKAKAVRDQVIVDMREGRKWNVQIALISQSVDDFDPVMIEFATSVYILDAGPKTAIEKTSRIFGLSETAQIALRNRVHGPREGGATFLAQFATKSGMNTQLLTCTLGPVELWAFSTTVEDVTLRNKLYQNIGPKEARRVLATLFPSGSVGKIVENKLNQMREEDGLIAESASQSVLDELSDRILSEYTKNPNFQRLTGF